MPCLLRTITQPAFFQSLICRWRPAPTHAPTIMITLRRNETRRYTAKSAPGILSGWEVPVFCFTGFSEERPHVFLHVFQIYWVSRQCPHSFLHVLKIYWISSAEQEHLLSIIRSRSSNTSAHCILPFGAAKENITIRNWTEGDLPHREKPKNTVAFSTEYWCFLAGGSLPEADAGSLATGTPLVPQQKDLAPYSKGTDVAVGLTRC